MICHASVFSSFRGGLYSPPTRNGITMSIRFPTDNDPGMSRSNVPRRPGGGGKLLLMLIIGVVAFMVMRGMARNVLKTPSIRILESAKEDMAVPSFPICRRISKRADQSDWAMEDGPVQRNAESKKSSTKSINADWAMEDVATQQDAKQPAGRFSQSSNSPIKESENKQPTTNGDWSLDSNIESTPKPTTPKKTTNGDWGLEEVE